VVIYQDTVNDAGRLKADVWMQTSTDDGQTWTNAVRVTSAASDETTAGADPNQYGDYTGLSGFLGTFFPSWTDRRAAGAEEIWTSRLSVVEKQCYFIVDKSTFGQDEVQAMLLQGNATVNAALWGIHLAGVEWAGAPPRPPCSVSLEAGWPPTCRGRHARRPARARVGDELAVADGVVGGSELQHAVEDEAAAA